MQHFLADDAETIHVQVSGEGPPLVLLHGWSGSRRDWNPFIEALGARRQIFRWDARGHGGHALHTPTLPTVTRMAQDLELLLDHWQLDRVALVGHSMGALTLWQYLQDFGSARIERIAIIDQSPRLLTDADWRLGIYGDFDAARNAAFIAALEQDFPEALLRLVALGLNDAARQRYLDKAPGIDKARQWLHGLAPAPLIDCWKSLSAADYRAGLAHIDVPALLIYGSASNFYVADTARYVQQHIPDARLSIYPGADHAPHLADRERFVSELLEFLG